jgi:hypothetical protein
MAELTGVQLKRQDAEQSCFVDEDWEHNIETCLADTKSRICQDASFDKNIIVKCGEIVHEQLNSSSASGKKITQSFVDAYSLLDTKSKERAIQQQWQKNDGGRARKEAGDAFGYDQQLITEASDTLKDENPNTLFDPTPILKNYLSGQVNLLFGCTGANEREDSALHGDNNGEDNCASLHQQYTSLTIYTGKLFAGTSTFLTPLQRSQLFLQASVASTSMRDHSSEVDYTDSGYLMTDLHAGWQMPLSNTKLFNAIPMGGPSVAISWSHISSDINSFGSNRDKGSLDIGWKQPLFNIPLSENSLNAYLWPSAGIGLSHNELNFGLPQLTSSQWSGTLSSQAILGAELCFNSGVCPSLYGGYAYDRTLWGEPDYHNQGIVAGGAVAFRPFKLKADQK